MELKRGSNPLTTSKLIIYLNTREMTVNSLVKKQISVLDTEVTTKKQRNNLVQAGAMQETLGWWQVAKGLYETKQAINGADPEYATIKTDKNGTPVLDNDGNEIETYHTFKSYCEETFEETGLSRSRREELVTAWGIILELRQYGFEAQDLPMTANQATLLAKWDMADRESVWSEYIDNNRDMSVLKQPVEIIENDEAEEVEDEMIEDIQEKKPLEWFAQQFLDRIGDQEAEDENKMAILAMEIIRKIEHFTYEVEESAE